LLKIIERIFDSNGKISNPKIININPKLTFIKDIIKENTRFNINEKMILDLLNTLFIKTNSF